MLLIKPNVNYLKGHRLIRFRSKDKDGSSLWRKMEWVKNKAKAVIKTDKLEKEYSTSTQFIIFDGDYINGYVEK
tara:strand:+ start:291 stop:512 length:222 start_codon:yes stop_codon:yes gene_type:complete